MGQQVLRTVIAIGGNVDNSFGRVGTALLNLGSQIDQISEKLINIGKASVETFVQYDDLMRETQAVGGYTAAELKKLDALNREIAQTTTYTNIQSAEAMVLIAQAGKDVEDTYQLLPSVLDLAMAGNLDLADSVDYLLSSLTALDKEMAYSGVLTDQMAKTAALGMTDIDTLGESLMRLGSASGEFFDSSEEILTILSVMSQFGHDQRGAQAGTWLRNFMLSLAAPTGNIDDIVDAMEQLGVAEAEIEEFTSHKSNGIAAEAVNSLIEQGLTIYDEQGKLLPAIEIIKSLRDTVRGNAEYADDLTEMTAALKTAGGDIDAFVDGTEGLSDNALYSVFSKIFGKRGITTAMNLIRISDEEWAKTFSEILNSEGFADSMAETMQGGPGGAFRELNAAVTELKTTLGEISAPGVEKAADFLHDAAVSISNMDEETLETLMSSLTGVAIAGPGLMAVGSAVRLIASLATPAGMTALAIAGIGAGVWALIEMNERIDQDMADNFGDMALDMAALESHVSGLGAGFRESMSEINGFNAALEESIQDYTAASQTFSGELLTAALTGAEITEADEERLRTLGQQIHSALLGGIATSTASTMSYWELLFGGEGTAEGNAEYRGIIDLTNQSYQEALAQAEGLSKGLRDALTSAFDDGTVSAEEYAEIQSWMQAYNDAMAQAAAEAKREDDYVAFQRALKKAQTGKYEDIIAYSGEIQTARDTMLQDEADLFEEEYFRLKYRWEQAIAGGWLINGETATEEGMANALKAAEEAYRQRVSEIDMQYDASLAALWQTSMEGSDLAGGFGDAAYQAGLVLAGSRNEQDAMAELWSRYGRSGYGPSNDYDINGQTIATQMGGFLKDAVESFGGHEAMLEKADAYAKAGNQQMAEYLRQLSMMELLINEFANTFVTADGTVYGARDLTGAYFGGPAAYQAPIEIEDAEKTAAEANEAMQNYLTGNPLQQTIQMNVSQAAAAPAKTGGSGANLIRSIFRMDAFAEGGRATQASIFGEAGAEWAIPEAHTQNTANLLREAAQASGFTWGEIAATGSSGRGTSRNTLVYSPTIVASDARGVEEKLKEDKDRLEKWLNERELMDKIAVYG